MEFNAGTAPDATNLLTATPTLEMGIDLSSVMLTSVPRTPASYTQRVGRSGHRNARLPPRTSKLKHKALDTGRFLRAVIDASVGDAQHVDAFLVPFGNSLSECSRDLLREFAAAGIEAQVKEAVDTWTEHQDDV